MNAACCLAIAKAVDGGSFQESEGGGGVCVYVVMLCGRKVGSENCKESRQNQAKRSKM